MDSPDSPACGTLAGLFVVTGSFTNGGAAKDRGRGAVKMEPPIDNLTPSEEASANPPRRIKDKFYKGQHVWVVLGKNKEDAVIHSIANDSPDSLADNSDNNTPDSTSDDSADYSPAIVTIRWTTRGTLENFPIDSIRPMFNYNDGDIESSSYSKRSRKKTDKYAPSSIYSANSPTKAKVTPTKMENQEDTTNILTVKKRKNLDVDECSVAGAKKPKGSIISTAEVTPSDKPQHSHTYVLSTVYGRDLCFNHLDSYQETISDTTWDSHSRKRSTDAASERQPSKKEDTSQIILNDAGGPRAQEATFHCHICSKDLRFFSAQTASALFGKHLRSCRGALAATDVNNALSPTKAGMDDDVACRLQSATTPPPPHLHNANPNDRNATGKTVGGKKGTKHNVKCRIPGPGWKKSNTSGKTCWLSPGVRIKFVNLRAALKYEELRKKYDFDDARAWNEHLIVSAGVEDSRYQLTMGNISKNNRMQGQHNSSSLRSTEPSAIIPPDCNNFYKGQLVYVIAGKASHEALILSIETCAETNGHRMATVRYKSWRKEVDKVEMNQLREIHDGSKRARETTNRYAPPLQPSKDLVSRSSQLNDTEDFSLPKALSKKAKIKVIGQEKQDPMRKTCGDRKDSQARKCGSMMKRAVETGEDRAACGQAACLAVEKKKTDRAARVGRSLHPGPNKSKLGGPVRKRSAYSKDESRNSEPKKMRSKIEKEERSAKHEIENEIENEYNLLWEIYMEKRVRKNDELFGSEMVLREKVAECALLRPKNDTLRPKVYKKIKRLQKDGEKREIVRILRLIQEADSGKLSPQQLKEKILGQTNDDDDDIEVFDSLATCEPLASINLTELDDEGIDRELSYVGESPRQHHPDTSISNVFDNASRPSNYQREVAEYDVARSSFSFDDVSVTNDKVAAISRKISEGSAHSSQAHNPFKSSPTRRKCSISPPTIDNSEKAMNIIDLSRDDDTDGDDSQQAQRKQKGAVRIMNSVTNESFNEGLVDLSQDSDDKDYVAANIDATWL